MMNESRICEGDPALSAQREMTLELAAPRSRHGVGMIERIVVFFFVVLG